MQTEIKTSMEHITSPFMLDEGTEIATIRDEATGIHGSLWVEDGEAYDSAQHFVDYHGKTYSKWNEFPKELQNAIQNDPDWKKNLDLHEDQNLQSGFVSMMFEDKDGNILLDDTAQVERMTDKELSNFLQQEMSRVIAKIDERHAMDEKYHMHGMYDVQHAYVKDTCKAPIFYNPKNHRLFVDTLKLGLPDAVHVGDYGKIPSPETLVEDAQAAVAAYQKMEERTESLMTLDASKLSKEEDNFVDYLRMETQKVHEDSRLDEGKQHLVALRTATHALLSGTSKATVKKFVQKYAPYTAKDKTFASNVVQEALKMPEVKAFQHSKESFSR